MKLPKDVRGRFQAKPKGDANLACPVCGFAKIDHMIDEKQYCRLMPDDGKPA